ncbi:PREDICTED: uncharacterized protein LOC105140822 isoform X2 [Populus euphratica]|uniref:Uncharacterized protein LOC105140822 isoform X2 n=1 Tax=Populus euphratica TaxID=75702 RepID=A0AAJ6VEQ2_POPEU|nr:PREDICTED: uncharacterized protein LOC105140822 isoform X2 [Populus euphratica]
MHLEILTLRKLHDCPHLCHEACCPAQCPSPDKCTKMVPISHLIIQRLVKRNILLMYKTLMLFQLPVINLICHTNSIQGLYSLSMPSLEIGDAMSRGFKLHIVKQALIPKIHLKTILDLNFFLGILLAKVQVVDQELHLCKPKDLEEKVPATKIHSPKHQNRRERLQEQRRPHKMRIFLYSVHPRERAF